MTTQAAGLMKRRIPPLSRLKPSLTLQPVSTRTPGCRGLNCGRKTQGQEWTGTDRPTSQPLITETPMDTS